MENPRPSRAGSVPTRAGVNKKSGRSGGSPEEMKAPVGQPDPRAGDHLSLPPLPHSRIRLIKARKVNRKRLHCTE